MRLYLGILLLFLTIGSCSNVRNQVIDTRFSNYSDSTDFHISRDSEIIVIYSFWGNGGRMAFIVQNNSDKSIYIDWFKSSLILQGVRHPYWSDVQVMSSRGSSQIQSRSKSNEVSSFLPFDLSTLSIGTHSGLTVVNKQERISFVPPKAKVVIEISHILIDSIFKKDWTEYEIESSYSPKRKERIKTKEFTRSNTPMIFRNFMSWSFSENFEIENYIDHEFWVEKVTSMTNAQFEGKKRPDNGYWISTIPYKSPKRFFIQFTQ